MRTKNNMWRLPNLTFLIIALVGLLSCGGGGDGEGNGEMEIGPRKSDCRLGQILRSGDSCTYPGRPEVVSVNQSGEGCLDSDCDEDEQRFRRTKNGQVVLELQITPIGSVTWGITQLGDLTTTVREILRNSDIEDCEVGLKLNPGEICLHGTLTFEVRQDGFACWFKVFCSYTSIRTGSGLKSNFHATRSNTK